MKINCGAINVNQMLSNYECPNPASKLNATIISASVHRQEIRLYFSLFPDR